MNILSIQSAVVYGHVGNSAAVLPLQRLGHEVWPLNTVQFSNHTGYGDWRGLVFSAADLAGLLDGIARRGVLADCHAVLSGYLGEAATGQVVLDAVARGRAANPRLLYCCDPVMGDTGKGLFVSPEIPHFFREHALAEADIVTPNRFELEILAGHPVEDLDEVVEAARGLRAHGPETVVVTSLAAPAVSPGTIGTLLVGGDSAWLVETPLIDLPCPAAGTGDVFTALFLGHCLSGMPPPSALEKTVNGIYALLAQSLAEKALELPLVAAQQSLIDPPLRFAAKPLA
jgi:pyridoxine kinase